MIPATTNGGGQCFAFPDVCKTPVGNSTPPIPYPNIAQCTDLKTSSCPDKIRICKKYAGVIGSEITMSSGDEAGTVGGVVSGSNKKKAVYTSGYPKVLLQGKVAAFLTSVATQNNSNIVGAQVAPSQTKVLYSPVPVLGAGQSVSGAITSTLESLRDLPQDEAEQPTPHLIRVEYLDGADDRILAGTGTQYVNLPDREDKWVDGTRIPNKDRVGRTPRILVEFDQPGQHAVKLRVRAGNQNAVYSSTEQGQGHGRFKLDKIEQDLDYTTGGDGKLIIDDLPISVAGKDRYYVKASDQEGAEITSNGDLLTDRHLSFQPFKMDASTGTAPARSLGPAVAQFNANGISLAILPDGSIPAYENVDETNQKAFLDDARKAFEADGHNSKDPYRIGIAFTSHLAVKVADRALYKAAVAGATDPIRIQLHGGAKDDANVNVQDRFLWNNLVSGEDWFVSAKWTPDEPTSGEQTLPKSCFTLAPTPGCPADMTCRLLADLSSIPPGPGVIELRVNYVDRMRAGLAFPDTPICCVCTRAWWRDIPDASQNQTVVHEAGHLMGMTADGKGTGIDKIPTHYDRTKSDHRGNHCHHGVPDGQARYETEEDRKKSDCVMWGSTNGHIAFCEHCSLALRKQDLQRS